MYLFTFMDILLQELTAGIPDGRELEVIIIRLAAAALLGMAIGIERQRAGKAAGIRTHMLVTVGTAAFVLAVLHHGMTSDGLSRVIQGIITGIGFIGAGTIIKLDSAMDVKGLTTSAGIWISAAIGVTIGMGLLGLAIMVTLLTLVILAVTVTVDNRINKGRLMHKGNKH